jgi:hypothetical protein
MPNYSLAYTTAITATYSDTNQVQTPFEVKADSDWTSCIQKSVNFNGATTPNITRTQLQNFFSDTGLVGTDSVRTHMTNTIASALGDASTQTALIDAYNNGKDFNQQVEAVGYTVDATWKNTFKSALTNNTDVVDVSTVANNEKFRLIFTFNSTVPTTFSKTVGIEWNVSGA